MADNSDRFTNVVVIPTMKMITASGIFLGGAIVGGLLLCITIIGAPLGILAILGAIYCFQGLIVIVPCISLILLLIYACGGGKTNVKTMENPPEENTPES